MRHGSLFSGIGGFDLASEWMGWENVFHCEWNEFGKKVLHHYWPNAESFDDITKTDFTKYANKIDILTGGFPCQPYSSAGKRLGKEDERHLWPQMLRAIREIKPKYIVGENVFGLLNWNGGMVFDEVHSDLELEGYEVQAVVIPAAAVNAPHGRDRVWFVATNTKFKSEGSDGGTNDETKGNIRRGNEGDVFGTLCGNGVTPNPDNTRTNDGLLSYRNGQKKNNRRKGEPQFEYRANGNDGDVTDTTSPGGAKDNGIGKSRFNDQTSSANSWDNFPTQSPICGGDDGLPTELDRITFSKWRNESIKAYGNAIVPQVALEIFKAIERVDNEML
jgi:DNA (cytosine-5)-methyltransferase 1